MAKILALVPGLKKEASAAASCQFLSLMWKNGRPEKLLTVDEEVIIRPFPEKVFWMSPIFITPLFTVDDSSDSAITEYKDYWQIRCGGACRNTIDPSGMLDKAYLCYYCTDTILCPDC